MNKFIIGGIIILALVGMLIIFYISKPKSKDDRCLDDSDCIKGLSCIGKVCSDKCKATGSDCNATTDTCCGANGTCVGNICIDCVSSSGSCTKDSDCCSGNYCDNTSKTCTKQATCSQTTCNQLSDCCTGYNSCFNSNCSTISTHDYIFKVARVAFKCSITVNSNVVYIVNSDWTITTDKTPFQFTLLDTDTITIIFDYNTLGGKKGPKTITINPKDDIISSKSSVGLIYINFESSESSGIIIRIKDYDDKILYSYTSDL